MEVLYIYNPQNETVMASHQEEVEELFKRVTVEIPGVTTGRAISLESFKAAIDIMMDKAYKLGQLEGFHEAEGVVDQIFNRS
jgi:hypothetical protein